jgi:glyoxylase-like metal-dependent hydrolase (beta-lactamase superfamily II)
MQLGNIRIDRIVDIEDGVLPRHGFPGLDEDKIREYAAALGPRLVDASALVLRISVHAFLVRTPQRTILVDSCVGAAKTRMLPEWNLRTESPFLAGLDALGVSPEAVDVVMCTHMHADHVGWNTRLVDGAWVPTFPNARYLMAETEFRFMQAETERLGSTFAQGCFADSVLPVVKHGQAEMVATAHRVEAGINTEPVPGHTPGSVLIHIEDDGEHGICIGDLIHHPFQLACPEMPTGFCHEPELAARQRVNLCRRYADTPTVIFPGHFPAPTAGRIVRKDRAFGFVYCAPAV